VTLQVELVSAERLVWTGEARMVTTRTTEGKIGIMTGHEPVLALLVEGRITFELVDGTELHGAVSGGFLSVAGDDVEVIAETAELAHEIDVARAQAALERASVAPEDDPYAEAAEKRAKARLSAAQHQGLLS
jgi:F-type H+-transporting ATPase subunit epsilon